MLSTLYMMVCLAGTCRVDEIGPPVPAAACERALSKAIGEARQPERQVFASCIPTTGTDEGLAVRPARSFIPPQP